MSQVFIKFYGFPFFAYNTHLLVDVVTVAEMENNKKYFFSFQIVCSNLSNTVSVSGHVSVSIPNTSVKHKVTSIKSCYLRKHKTEAK